ncbi:hypothetical protein LTR41_007991 [Exophiala xenobiotica]|nr:hypothetical protein LTR41_007991 [Exophiala xenobiotica]KAK5321077.1 hypothetical protein LTR93_006319 [Exophiala xenobiotica]
MPGPTIFLCVSIYADLGRYVGGTTLDLLLSRYPHARVTTLVRTKAKGAAIRDCFATVTTLIGDLDSTEIITSESAKADVVFNLAQIDHHGAINAIIAGLQMSAKSRRSPVYYIQISGARVLCDPALPSPGTSSDTAPFDDLTGLERFWALPATNIHRKSELLVSSATTEKIKTAIVCPPLIHGLGSGPDRSKLRSMQLDLLAREILRRKRGFTVLGGANSWSCINVRDLASAIVRIFEEAVVEATGVEPGWGQQGYYFVESEQASFRDITQALVDTAVEKGWLRDGVVEALSPEEAQEISPFGAFAWGSHAVCRAERIRELGWRPVWPGVKETLVETVYHHAELLEKGTGKENKLAHSAH